MAITRAKQSSLKTGVVKYDNFRGGLPYTPTIGTATDGGTGTTVSVAFTGNNTAGLTYTALSTPGSLSATGTTSPITVTGLTSGTAYTFAVKATNSAGDSPYSAASNSVTPATPTAFESIASATPSGTGTVTFSSIPGTYKSLQIRCNIVYSSTSLVRFQYNSDTGSNYARHILYGDGSVAGADASASYTSNAIIYVGGSTGTNVGIVDIHDYASTTKYKTSRTFSGNDNNGSGYITSMSGLWMSTSAVTNIDILCSSNFLSGTTFALYGIKG
jgi:hypothetical protein